MPPCNLGVKETTELQFKPLDMHALNFFKVCITFQAAKQKDFLFSNPAYLIKMKVLPNMIDVGKRER